ncbi:MAG: amino acid ABC transporter ATP-binding protein [Firmicutes bacterium]|nr:amino acid ABC transporter ATP-binding protein [Bacillota bacterium]
MGTIHLEIKNLRKKYGDFEAVRGVNLEVARGEVVVIMGPSGCGKSTVIRCINRLVEPTEGEIWFDGLPVHDLSQKEMVSLRRRIGFVFQNFNLIHRLNVLQNVMLGLIYAGVDKDQALEQAEEALRKVGLLQAAGKRPSMLSGGQQQRVGIARALALQPELMLWDEPTASLDPILVREVLDVMEDLAQSSGTTMVIVTHEVPFALRVADRIVLMAEGQVVEEGAPDEIFRLPRSGVGHKYLEIITSQYHDVTEMRRRILPGHRTEGKIIV